MRGAFAALALAPTVLAAAPGTGPRASVATERLTRIDLLTRRIEFAMPPGFVRATDRINGTNVLIEFVPAGQTVANWTRMITIQAYRGLGKSPYPTSQIARQAFYPAACKTGPLFRDFGEQSLGGDLKRTIIANGCASLPAGAYPKTLKGAGEQDFILIFRDAESLYTLNYAERGASYAGKAPPLAMDRAAEILSRQFGAVRLIPLR